MVDLQQPVVIRSTPGQMKVRLDILLQGGIVNQVYQLVCALGYVEHHHLHVVGLYLADQIASYNLPAFG